MSEGLKDGYVRGLLKNHSPNLVVPWLLMASVLYYHFEVSLLSDAFYDELCKTLLDTWDNVKHEHKSIIEKGDLEAGSLYRLKLMDYPLRTRAAAAALACHDPFNLDREKCSLLAALPKQPPTSPSSSPRPRRRVELPT